MRGLEAEWCVRLAAETDFYDWEVQCRSILLAQSCPNESLVRQQEESHQSRDDECVGSVYLYLLWGRDVSDKPFRSRWHSAPPHAMLEGRWLRHFEHWRYKSWATLPIKSSQLNHFIHGWIFNHKIDQPPLSRFFDSRMDFLKIKLTRSGSICRNWLANSSRSPSDKLG